MKFFTLIVVIFLITHYINYSITPSKEIYDLKIIVDGLQTNTTLFDFEKFLIENGKNTIEYEIYAEIEIIMIAKRIDNLTKKIIISKFQFDYLNIPHNKKLSLIGGIIDGRNVSAYDIKTIIIYPIDSRKEALSNEKFVENNKKILKKIPGSYTGYFINNEDKNEKKNIELTLYSKSEKNSINSNGFIKIDEIEIEIKWSFFVGGIRIYQANFKSKNKFEFNGKLDDNLLTGESTISIDIGGFFTKKIEEKTGFLNLIKLED